MSKINDKNKNPSLFFEEVEYNGDEKSIMNKFKFLNYDVLIVGSYSLVSQRYTSDIDALSLVTGKKDKERFNEEFKLILRDIEIDNDIYFLEAKIQYNNGKKLKFFKYDKFDIPNENFNDIYFIKFDTIVFINGIFKAFDMIYYFRYTDDLVGDIKKDIIKYKKEGLYLKVLKRYFSISKINNDAVTARIITLFLNSKSGRDYELYNNLKTIILLLENYGDDVNVRDKVRIVLNILGIPNKVSVIEDKIKILSNKINSDAKIFLDKLQNKKI